MKTTSASTFAIRTVRLAATLAVATVLSVAAVAPFAPAEAAPKAGFGNRGTRTFQAPPQTQTAPRTAQPIERTQAQRPAQPATPGATGTAQPGGFMNGFGGTMLKGLLIGGLIGALLGGGFGGFAGFLGLILQVALIAGGIWLVMRLIRSRQQPAAAGAGGPLNRDAGPGLGGGGLGGMPGDRGPSAPGGAGQPPAGYGPPSGYDPPAGQRPATGGLGGLLGGLGGLGGNRQARLEPSDDLGLDGTDFEAFERLLGQIQTAFGRGDLETLREHTTHEVFQELESQLDEMKRQGLVNEISGVKLLRGDLAEAWREGMSEYATVAMQFEMVDATRETATGRVVDGDPERPTEITQVWTFWRQRGTGAPGPWVLSAMQDVE
ncbi:Tim44 domain-containing protein [Prosthecomicrobium sp. N25]|uniref:Tim44 domain-containing protein n=1 Tax=Prosthecomicrobium sp. N25 TaxID=3129254 RepID=UPI00307881F8